MQPYKEAPSPPMTPELAQACAETMHVLCRDGRILRSGRAALYILEGLGWRRSGMGDGCRWEGLGWIRRGARVGVGSWRMGFGRNLSRASMGIGLYNI